MYLRFGKRAFDLSAALIGLIVLLIPLILVATTVWIAMGRPVFFSQDRVGRNGRIFRIRKVRTMVNGAADGGPITTATDGRVTGLGHFLRRWKLDELPQLWNVLVGEMSLVGPRPDVPGYADRLEGASRHILTLRPGITGPATLAFRNEEELLASVDDPAAYNDKVVYCEKTRLNLTYLHTCSFKKDLDYVWQTLRGT